MRDLVCRTTLGCRDWERTEAREVVLNLEVETDLATPARTDDLGDAVDYGALCRVVLRHVEECRYSLLEALAESVAGLVLGEFPGVSAVTVRADNPGAVRFARSVAVELRRTRP